MFWDINNYLWILYRETTFPLNYLHMCFRRLKSLSQYYCFFKYKFHLVSNTVVYQSSSITTVKPDLRLLAKIIIIILRRIIPHWTAFCILVLTFSINVHAVQVSDACFFCGLQSCFIIFIPHRLKIHDTCIAINIK